MNIAINDEHLLSLLRRIREAEANKVSKTRDKYLNRLYEHLKERVYDVFISSTVKYYNTSRPYMLVNRSATDLYTIYDDKEIYDTGIVLPSFLLLRIPTFTSNIYTKERMHYIVIQTYKRISKARAYALGRLAFNIALVDSRKRKEYMDAFTHIIFALEAEDENQDSSGTTSSTSTVTSSSSYSPSTSNPNPNPTTSTSSNPNPTF